MRYDFAYKIAISGWLMQLQSSVNKKEEATNDKRQTTNYGFMALNCDEPEIQSNDYNLFSSSFYSFTMTVVAAAALFIFFQVIPFR